ERGRHGSYHLRPGFKLPPLMFTEDEALGLTLGLLITRRLGISVAPAAVEGALAKVERVMPQSLKERVQAVQNALVVDISVPAFMPDSRVISALSAAIQNSQSVYLGYRSWQGEPSERMFDPYGLVYHSGYWYTAGYCHLREAVRTFRLDRVVSVANCDDHFLPPADFDALQVVLRGIASTPGTYEIEVLLQTTLAEAQREIS